MLHSHRVIIVLGDICYLQAPYSHEPRWMLCFVRPLLTGERWNLLQFDATQCMELNFTALLFKFMSTLYLRSVAYGRDSGPHSSEARRGSPPRHAVKNSRGTFSHCNPIFPRKGLFRERSFPQRLHHFAVLLHRKYSSCGPSWTGDPVLQRGAPSRPLWSTRWLLNGGSQVSFTRNIKQHARGWLTCLFDLSGSKCVW